MDAHTEAFIARRRELWTLEHWGDRDRRTEYADLVDAWLRGLFAGSAHTHGEAALVAVGGTGRRELAPRSDLDLVLLHTGGREVAALADDLWYPIWDSAMALDHSVRTVDQALGAARDDLKVAMGLLDVRHIAGDEALTRTLREKALAQWRASASVRLPELRADAKDRAEQYGELAYLLEPDLKEAYGGIREVTNLRGVSASWLVDVPRSGVAEAHAQLLEVRDALHAVSGRASDRLLLHDQHEIASVMGLAVSNALLRQTCAAGRTLAYASEVTWYRMERALRRPKRRILGRRPSPELTRANPLGVGVVEFDGEAVLARDADPASDVALGLRAAAAAAQAGAVLAPSAVERIRQADGDLPDPWPRDARESLVALLGAGPSALPVWEAMDQAGLWARWLPGWERLRALPQRNPVHRFTVDRHLVEVAVQAAALTDRVERPDLLVIGALLHDVGKGLPGDHTEQGIPLVERYAQRMGFDQTDTDTLVDLCRHHLLLPEMATRRDLDDPATVEQVATAVGTSERLELLYALTQADARGTGPLAWTPWRAALVAELVRRTHAVLEGEAPPDQSVLDQHPASTASGVVVTVEPQGPAWLITVGADDAPGLLSIVAGVLSVHRLSVQVARLHTVDARAVQFWTVHGLSGEAPDADALRDDVVSALAGHVSIPSVLARRPRQSHRARTSDASVSVPSRVDVIEEASELASVIEVRTRDEPTLLHRLAATIAASEACISSARVSTMGAEAIDVFYLVDAVGEPLGRTATAQVVRALLEELPPGPDSLSAEARN